MAVQRFDDPAEEQGLGAVVPGPAQARALAGVSGLLRVLGMVQAALTGGALLLLLVGLYLALYGERGPGFSGLDGVTIVALILVVFQVGAPTLQGLLLAGAGGDLDRLGRAGEQGQPLLLAAFGRVRTVFLIEVIVALMLLIKELRFVL